MLVTLSGIVMLVKPLQPEKAYKGIIVTLFPILIVVSFEQFDEIWFEQQELVSKQ